MEFKLPTIREALISLIDSSGDPNMGRQIEEGERVSIRYPSKFTDLQFTVTKEIQFNR